MQFIASLVAQLVKNPPQCRKARFSPWVGKIPWRREWLPIPVFLPGEFHGQGSMKGYFFPWSHEELDMTERLTSSACQLYLNKAIYLKIKASLNFLFRFCALPRNNWTSTLCSRCPSFALQIPNLPSVLFSAGKLIYRDQIKDLLHLLVLTGFSQWWAQTGLGGREEMHGPEPGYLYPVGHSKSGLLYRILCFQVLVSPFSFLPFWSRSSNSSSKSCTISFCFPNTFTPFKIAPGLGPPWWSSGWDSKFPIYGI